MAFEYFSKSGQILPISDAVIPLASIEYAYGFGVYETIRVSNGKILFLGDHLDRLAESAGALGLEHPFTSDFIETSIKELLEKNAVGTCNLKLLLIGASRKEDAQLYMICLNPLFPDKKLYRDGIAVTTYEYERPFPHAKTLNMLQSYLAYREAVKTDAYDALLINSDGFITEGTRTNFFCIKDRTIYSPLESEILLGVTRKNLLDAARQGGYEVVEKNIAVADLVNYDGAFISSTSSKIMPIRSVGDMALNPQSESFKNLMGLVDKFLSEGS